MFKTLLMQYGLKAIGKGAAILGGILSAKYGVDGDTAASISSGVAAAGGLILTEAVDWYQKNRMVKKSESATAKVQIVAEAVNVPIPTTTIELPPATAPTTPVDHSKPIGTAKPLGREK